VQEWKDKSQVHLDRLTISRVAHETLAIYGSALAAGSKNAAVAA
jgi:hypothetical protein